MFYTISDRYIDYLSKENPHVLSNKPETRTYHRKYIGLITSWESTPILFRCHLQKNSDYLENGEIKKDSLIKIYMRSEKTLYGTIHFNYMIPVPAAELTEFTMNDEGDFKYKVLMQSEYFFYQGKQKQNRKDRCTTLQNADNI